MTRSILTVYVGGDIATDTIHLQEAVNDRLSEREMCTCSQAAFIARA